MNPTSPAVRDALHAWPKVQPILAVPQTEQEYHALVALLDSLIDEVGENESHPWASLMDVVSVLIERYEDDHVPLLQADAGD